jgi:putative tryptophan/tyrosine transport system substrate-binding protein
MFDRKRREFITLLGGATAWPLAARAQQPGKVLRIGYLGPATGRSPVDDAFEEGLQQHGWTKDQNIRIEYRYTGGRQDTVLPLVTEVVGLGVDVLVTWGPPLSLAAKRASTQIPLVFLITFDPVDLGLVSNLARPGGNVTGLTSLASLEIFAKRLQFLREFLPSLARVAVLASTEQTRSSRANDALTTAAKGLGIELHDLEIQAPAELEGVIRNAKDQGTQALYVWPSGFTFSFAKQISDIANAHGLPSCHAFREGALAGGGLLAYAADLKEEARRGAAYVDKILRGTPPGILPIEQLSKYELLINLRTAKALGLAVPPNLLATADEVIE